MRVDLQKAASLDLPPSPLKAIQPPFPSTALRSQTMMISGDGSGT
jgi:hypothetical protein